MNLSYLVYLGAFIVFALASAFFSGTETTFFSLNQIDLAKFRDDHSRKAQRVMKLMADSRKLLITILIGNTLVNICAATVATLLVTRLSRDLRFGEGWGIFLEVVVVTFVILVFSEIMPKMMAVRHAPVYALRISFLVDLVFILFYPFSTALERFTDLFAKIFKTKGERYFLSEEEIKTMVALGEEKGAIQVEEKEMIDSIFEFGETAVREIMIPRIDMICVEIKSSLAELIQLIREKGHSRIPIYEDRIDNIKGIVHAKDLIPFLDHPDRKLNLPALARPAYFVPESKKIDDLLREFQREKIHMAIVVDEYGGTAGLVTMEDVIEEIVGEIQDEYDKEMPLYRTIDANTFVVDSRMSIAELNEVLPEPIPQAEEEDYETLGGLIYHITGSVPNKNDRITFHDYVFIIEDVDRQRIKKVKVVKVQSQPKTDENQN